nr:retrovirus-related Pol polyprotein from transposon TNT 1-94 [Tanacetum cinerariifolium]
AKAVNTASYLVNRSPSTSIDLKTPQEVWFGKPSNYFDLRIFVCPAYAYVNDGEHEPRVVKCIFLGYAIGFKGYRLWSTEGNNLDKFLISIDVTFDESAMIGQSKGCESFAGTKDCDADQKEADNTGTGVEDSIAVRKGKVMLQGQLAPTEAIKENNIKAENLRGMDKAFKISLDGTRCIKNQSWLPLFGNLRDLIMHESHKSKYFIHPDSDKMYQEEDRNETTKRDTKELLVVGEIPSQGFRKVLVRWGISEVQVYTLSTRTWKKVSPKPLNKPYGYKELGVYVEGFIYWLARDDWLPY